MSMDVNKNEASNDNNIENIDGDISEFKTRAVIATFGLSSSLMIIPMMQLTKHVRYGEVMAIIASIIIGVLASRMIFHIMCFVEEQVDKITSTITRFDKVEEAEEK